MCAKIQILTWFEVKYKYQLAVWLSIRYFYSHFIKVTRKCECFGRLVDAIKKFHIQTVKQRHRKIYIYDTKNH